MYANARMIFFRLQYPAFCSSRPSNGTYAAPSSFGDHRVRYPNIRFQSLHHGKIEDAVVRAVIHDSDGLKLQVDVVGLDLTALIDTRQVVD